MIEEIALEPRSHPQRILVTGASGFVGTHVMARLVELGHRVVGIGRRPLAIPGYMRWDLGRPLPPDYLRHFDVVVHAAARASPWGRRREFARDNVRATEHLLDACRRERLPRFVFISSSSVYYRPGHQLGITEATPLPPQAINAYAATKRQAERRVQDYPGSWAILRPRAVFGPGDTVLLPRILRAAAAGRLPLLEASDGEVIGDLIYIENLVDAIVTAALDPGIGGCINLTNNEPVPILAFLLDILERLGLPVPQRRVRVGAAMRMAGLIELLYGVLMPETEPPITRFGVHVFAYSKTFDVTKMLQSLGPPRVGLRDGVGRTVAWIKEGSPSTFGKS